MKSNLIVFAGMLLIAFAAVQSDELPPSLKSAIKNASIPMIVDATITKFDADGAAILKINQVFKPNGKAGQLPTKVRGYVSDEATQRIASMQIIVNKGSERFLLFLKGDVLYGTYNHNFEIREKDGVVEVNTGSEGWQPLAEIVKLIPQK